MIQKVAEAKELIVGKFYMVPCIKAQYKIIGFRQGEWVPVIGNIHIKTKNNVHNNN